MLDGYNKTIIRDRLCTDEHTYNLLVCLFVYICITALIQSARIYYITCIILCIRICNIIRYFRICMKSHKIYLKIFYFSMRVVELVLYCMCFTRRWCGGFYVRLYCALYTFLRYEQHCRAAGTFDENVQRWAPLLRAISHKNRKQRAFCLAQSKT